MEQLNLFDVIEGSKDNENPSENDLLKCYRTEFIRTEKMTLEDLFHGFNQIRIITFSYDLDFINKIIKNFDYAEIILGANFNVSRDEKLNDLLTTAYTAARAIRRIPDLTEMFINGNIRFRTPNLVIDHRKMYLLTSDDGTRTRVIKPSANLSTAAWNNTQPENYEFYDTPEGYDENLKDFETAWDMSVDIPLHVIASKKADDPIEGNAILKSVKETGKAIVLQNDPSPLSINIVKYVMDCEKIKEEYRALLKGNTPKAKNGKIEIKPKLVEKMKLTQKKSETNVTVNEFVEKYPELTFDFEQKSAFLNGEALDLSPSDEDIRKDINELLGIFSNYDSFTGDTDKLKKIHFKMLNAIFSSPFNAPLRCTAVTKRISTSSLPLFLLIASKGASCGKTFMITAALKMMTGKFVNVAKKEDYSKNAKEKMAAIQVGSKGVPFFIDEIDNRYIASIAESIKNDDSCENNQRDTQPMIIFASNNVLEPSEILRKRMVFNRVDGGLPSSIDQSAYKSRGNAIIKRLGTAFYRKYLSYMIDAVTNELDFLMKGDFPDDYYPELMGISSDIIIRILEEYGYDIPDYVQHLSWDNDYSVNAKYISDDVITEIKKLYNNHKSLFSFTEETVTIKMGDDSNSKSKCNSWANSLPTEFEAEYLPTKDGVIFTINRKELEKRTGIKFKKKLFNLFPWE
ncbi:phospholipase D family protein [Anaerovibrio sp. RM50]|uniref:phospholipase D family protein n=1 Tax=Anaerovibrio sp. RM50 TaxID=1200557 RepID=UPI000484E098|nr:phospholipase D family protein [Anaerovibrio sp. RM50]